LLSNEIALFTVIADQSWWFNNNAGKSGNELYAELFEHPGKWHGITYLGNDPAIRTRINNVWA